MIMAVSGRQGFNAWLGVDLVEADADAGKIVIRAPVRDEITQHHGYVHGGVLGCLADTAMAWVAALVAGDVVTQSYSLQFLAPAKGEAVVAEGRVIKEGRRAVSVEARVSSVADDGGETLVATALGSIWRKS
ncbi:MAG: PaaI family thioesterase [Pseudomonadota bacterium]